MKYELKVGMYIFLCFILTPDPLQTPVSGQQCCHWSQYLIFPKILIVIIHLLLYYYILGCRTLKDLFNYQAFEEKLDE